MITTNKTESKMEKENVYESVLMEMAEELRFLNHNTSEKYGYEAEYDTAKKMHYHAVLGGVIGAMVIKANAITFDRQEMEDEIKELDDTLDELKDSSVLLLPSCIFGKKYSAILEKRERLVAERNNLMYEEDQLMEKAYGLAYGDEFLEGKIERLRKG